MKKLYTVTTAALLSALLCVSASAAYSVRLECEEGVITGAAKDYKVRKWRSPPVARS